MVGNRQSPIRSVSPRVAGGGSTITTATLIMGPWGLDKVRASPNLSNLAPRFPIPLRAAPNLSLLQPHFVDNVARVNAPAGKIAPHYAVDTLRAAPNLSRLAPRFVADTLRAKPSAATFDVAGFAATKDAWVGVAVAGICTDDSNHNGDELRLSTLNNRQALVGWDMSTFGLVGASITVLSLKATFRTQAAGTIGGDTMNASPIDAANEGWSESTVKCSTSPPAMGSSATTASIPNATETDFTVDLSANGTAVAQFGAALSGGTSFTLRLAPGTTFADTERVLYDKENGGSSKAGRLAFKVKLNT